MSLSKTAGAGGALHGAMAVLAMAGSLGAAGCVHIGGAKAPPAPKPIAVCAPMARVDLIAATAPGRVALTGGGAAAASLLPACGPPFLAQRIKSSAGDRFILLIDDVQPAQAGGGFSFKEALATGLSNEASIVGALSYEAGPSKAGGRRLRFDVTKTIRAMLDANHLESLVVTLPTSTPAGSPPTAARMQIVNE